jgi:hypothetical protein
MSKENVAFVQNVYDTFNRGDNSGRLRRARSGSRVLPVGGGPVGRTVPPMGARARRHPTAKRAAQASGPTNGKGVGVRTAR